MLSQKLQQASDDVLNYNNQPISADDAAAMFRRRIVPNSKPYDADVMKLNNAMIDEWYTNVLLKICDRNGKLPCAKVYPAWTVFWEGKNLYGVGSDNRCYFFTPPLEVAHEWVNFFSNNEVSDIAMRGQMYTKIGISIITTAIQTIFMEKKWDVIYSKTHDPVEWLKLSNANPGIMRNRPLPFSLTEEKHRDISEKVNAVMGVSPDINSLSVDGIKKMSTKEVVAKLKIPIKPNTQPYQAQAAKVCNAVIDEWGTSMLKGEKFDFPQLVKMWSIFCEGREIASRQRNLKMFPEVPENIAHFWVKVFTTSNISSLHAFGGSNVMAGWYILLSFLRSYIAELKWRHIYSQSEDPREWLRLADENVALMRGDTLPFSLTSDIMADVNEKIQAFSKNFPEPA